MLRREPVVHREDGAAALGGERARDVVVGLDAAEHPAAAVEIEKQAERHVRARPVEPRRHAVRVDVAYLGQRDGGGLDAGRAERPHRLGRRGLERRIAERLELVEQSPSLGVQRHSVLLEA
jgi:hypothetical protein